MKDSNVQMYSSLPGTIYRVLSLYLLRVKSVIFALSSVSGWNICNLWFCVYGFYIVCILLAWVMTFKSAHSTVCNHDMKQRSPYLKVFDQYAKDLD